jgi:acyl carrier protein
MKGCEALEYVGPRTPVEEVLCKIWAEVLGLEPGQVGIHSNFFDLGGHSLMAGRVITRICREFQIELPLRSIFESPLISLLALLVDEARNKHMQVKHKAIRRVDRNSYVLS